MTTYQTFLVIIAAIMVLPAARGESYATNTPVSSLRLSEDRTQEMRVEFLLDVASAYSTEGNLQASIGAYERVLEIDPDHLQAKYQLSHVYIGDNQYRKAEALLFELMEMRPNDFTLLNNLAWIYATAKDPSIRSGPKAIEFAQRAMVLAPNDHHVWSTLSEAYYMSGEYEKAYRAITHMATLATRYSQNITEEAIADYNEQIRKCKRALDTANAMKEDE